MKEAGLDPGPKRGEYTWSEFISVHAATLWQCDFFGQKVLTWRGWRDCFVLAFIHVGTRCVFISPATCNPGVTWLGDQAAAFVRHLGEVGHDPAQTLLFRDRDGKYSSPFDDVLRTAGVTVRQTPVKAPNTNAFIERWGQGLRVECLDRMLALGETHLTYLVHEYVEHHNTERPHQSLGNRTLPEADSEDSPILPFPEHGIECRSRLGGLIKHYRRVA